jgi:pSer/pThr/pTyr-binding forkhead associated (FHA) protein
MHYRFTCITEPNRSLTEDFILDVVTIGRSIENNMVVDEAHVSGYHARVFEQSGQVLLEDLGSTNGTFINGKRVKSLTVLNDGDTLQFGTRVRFKISWLSEDYEDHTVVGTPQELPNDISQKPLEVPKPGRKKKIPIWVIIMLLVIILACSAVIVIGGLFALNLLINSG